MIRAIEVLPRPLTYAEYEFLHQLAAGLKADDIELFGNVGKYKEVVKAARAAIGEISWTTVPQPAQAIEAIGGGAGLSAQILGSAARLQLEQKLNGLIASLGSADYPTRVKAEAELKAELVAAIEQPDVTRVQQIVAYLKNIRNTTQDPEASARTQLLLTFAESFHGFEIYDAAKLELLSAGLGGAILGGASNPR